MASSSIPESPTSLSSTANNPILATPLHTSNEESPIDFHNAALKVELDWTRDTKDLLQDLAEKIARFEQDRLQDSADCKKRVETVEKDFKKRVETVEEDFKKRLETVQKELGTVRKELVNQKTDYTAKIQEVQIILGDVEKANVELRNIVNAS